MSENYFKIQEVGKNVRLIGQSEKMSDNGPKSVKLSRFNPQTHLYLKNPENLKFIAEHVHS